MDDTRFWSLIESAWESVGGKANLRPRLLKGDLDVSDFQDLWQSLEKVIPALRTKLDLLRAEDLLAFDRILERKLYDIDRADVHEQTDGSDDGFLYARGFIVAAGKNYYEAVNANPSRTVMGEECGAMCYLSFHLYEEKFGDVPPSGISRESQSNAAGWPEDS